MSASETPLRTVHKKRELTSPEDLIDVKKNRLLTDSGSESESDISDLSVVDTSQIPKMADTVSPGSSADSADPTSSQSSITLKPSDLEIIGGFIKNSFQPQISEMVSSIVSGVLEGLQSTIKLLQRENEELKARLGTLEARVDTAEQYSRRNCLRIAGVPEDSRENTDDYVIKLTGDLGVDVVLNDIDRSHRVGRPRASGRPRDIIVKFVSYWMRRRVYGVRTQTKTKGYMGVFINEDLTQTRSRLLRKARAMAKAKHFQSTWTSDGTVLVRDHSDKVHRISSDRDLAQFGPVPTFEPSRGDGVTAQFSQGSPEPPDHQGGAMIF